MKTNFQMMRELEKEYTPKQRGIVKMSEIYLINEKLCLDEMDELQLRNLRDFTVLYFDMQINNDENLAFELMDKMSAITTVIDQKLWNIGAEV